MNSSQQRFLNKGKKASVKNSNTEAGPVPEALFDQNSTLGRPLFTRFIVVFVSQQRCLIAIGKRAKSSLSFIGHHWREVHTIGTERRA
jgi:hypothetical protein